MSADDIRPVTSIRTYPNGDLNMNPLHLMTGAEAFQLGERARQVAFARARMHWHVLQTRYPFDRWKRTWMSPALGVRETHRLVGRYVLRPYGVPFRCLLPLEVDNLLVACRGASFSSIGASSCRLSRTMMILGQAAGTAAALFGGDVSRADAERLTAAGCGRRRPDTGARLAGYHGEFKL